MNYFEKKKKHKGKFMDWTHYKLLYTVEAS